MLCEKCKKEIIGKGIEVNKLTYCENCIDEFFDRCSCCNKLTLKIELIKAQEDEMICNQCKERFYIYCADCNGLHYINQSTLVDGNDICPICIYHDYSQCSDCDKWVKNDNTIETHNGDFICEECQENYFICYGCDTWHHLDDCNMYGDYCYCDRCFRNNFARCQGCRQFFPNEELYYSEREEEDFCIDCLPPDEEEEDNNGSIHSHDYKPFPVFHGKAKYFFGIELEIENKKQSISNGEAAYNTESGLFYCKEDGSLSYGFEIVSQPFSWREWEKSIKQKYEHTFIYLRNNGFVSYDTTTCGMHIHISKSRFTTYHLYKLLNFFYSHNPHNDQFILDVSQRESSRLDRWSKLSMPDRLAYVAKEKDHGDRYCAVNLQNEYTVEFRIFRGTLDHNSFCKNVEFIKAVCDFTEINKLKDITIENFIMYVIEYKKEYKNLHNFLIKKGYIEEIKKEKKAA